MTFIHGFQPAHRWTVLHIGLMLGLLHLPLSLELTIGLATHGAMSRSLLTLLYPVALALVGIGAALAHSDRTLAVAPMRAAGGVLLLFLLAVLRTNFLSLDTIDLLISFATHATTLGLWFLLLGFALARAIAQEETWGTGSVGPAWAIHLVGLVVGYLASAALVSTVGANGLILAAGVSLVLAPKRGVPMMVGLLVVFALGDVDRRVEQLREIGDWQELQVVQGEQRSSYDSQRVTTLLDAANEQEYVGWSHYGQVRVIRDVNDNRLVLYNLKRQYDLAPYAQDNGPYDPSAADTQSASSSEDVKMFMLRKAIYSLFRPEHKLLFIGIGSGRGPQLLPFEPDGSVTLVERDPSAARFFSKVRPELNDHLFSKANFEVADGRHIAETIEGPLDGIVIESARFQAPHTMLPATTPSYLFTQEAVETYLDKLGSSGLLVIEFHGYDQRSGRKKSKIMLPALIQRIFLELGVPHTLYRVGDRRQSLAFLACPQPGCLETWTDALDLSALDRVTTHPIETRKRYGTFLPLTDDHPFMAWKGMARGAKGMLFRVTGALALVGVLLAGLLTWFQARSRDGWNAVPYCFCVGVGHAAVSMHAFYAWRSYFGDEILTILRVMVYLLIYGALGSACARAVGERLPGWAARVGLTALALAVHLLATAFLPFEDTRLWVREVYGALALAPAGLTLGVFLPLGLSSASRAALGRNLCADSIGALVAYALIYVVYLPLGGTAYILLGGAIYLVAAGVLRVP